MQRMCSWPRPSAEFDKPPRAYDLPPAGGAPPKSICPEMPTETARSPATSKGNRIVHLFVWRDYTYARRTHEEGSCTYFSVNRLRRAGLGTAQYQRHRGPRA